MVGAGINGVKRWAALGVVLALGATLWFVRAEVLRVVPTPLLPMPAHEQYAIALVVAGLAESEAGRAWRAAADDVLDMPAEVTPQYENAAVLDGARPATAWRFAARRGQRVIVEARDAASAVFLDLFDAESRRRVASAPARSLRLEHVVGRDGPLVVRVQVPLPLERARQSGAAATAGATAISPAIQLAQRVEPSLGFPVQGVTARAVQSGFGVGRDSGQRRHEGIDIFAPRGTPVLAAAGGLVTQQTSNRLGGKVVWVWSPEYGVSLYYAHLDQQAVTPGARVDAGTILGYVGNTGNARSTAPHLHFGIYARPEGAVDPLPYVAAPAPPRKPVTRRRRVSDEGDKN